MRAVWPDSFVEQSNLTRTISVLRRVLSPNGGGPHYIETAVAVAAGHASVPVVRGAARVRGDAVVRRAGHRR